jgi:deoxyribonuclease-4
VPIRCRSVRGPPGLSARDAGSVRPVLFGAHVSSAGGISSAIDRAELLGCDAVQVFTQSPRMWKPTTHSEEQIARFRARREEVGIEAVVCHALYLVNLAGADRELHRKSVAAMRASLETAAAIGAEGVVFHVGSHLGRGLATGYRRAVPALRELLELTDERLWLILENSAGAGGTIGRSVDELACLFDRLDGHERLGICLDSCHWWVSGVDVTDPDALDAALAELDRAIGLDRLRCLHVNDAGASLGSNRDRHASLGLGEMKDGLATFVTHPAFETVPAILETAGPDGGYAGELRLLRELHRKGLRRLASRARQPTDA